jgi:uncharacterized protein YjbI with pentapeptide repeats
VQKVSTLEVTRLRNRWSEEEILRVNQALAASRIGELELPRHIVNGREYVDLRGMMLIIPMRDNHFEQVDLSYCVSGLSIGKVTQLLDTTFEDSRFVGARFDDMNCWVKARRCVFDTARFHVLGDIFEECSFVNAKMNERLVSDSRYIRCDFTNSDWRTTHALHHTFINCIWSGCKFGDGSFGWSRFVGTRPDPAMLGDTIMDDVVYE